MLMDIQDYLMGLVGLGLILDGMVVGDSFLVLELESGELGVEGCVLFLVHDIII